MRSVFDRDALGAERLLTACRAHSDGLMVGDITVVTCWDADRLDLGRVGIRPDPDHLCTEAARDPATLERAYQECIGGAAAGRRA